MSLVNLTEFSATTKCFPVLAKPFAITARNHFRWFLRMSRADLCSDWFTAAAGLQNLGAQVIVTICAEIKYFRGLTAKCTAFILSQFILFSWFSNKL